MKRSFLAVAGALALWTCAASAQEKAVGMFGWNGVGKTYEVSKGHFYWVGEFTGTFFNDKGEGSMFHNAGVKCPASFEVDPNGKTKGDGYCVISDKDGDQAFLKWQNAGVPERGAGTFRYLGGTGKYAGLSGENTFVGSTQVFWKDGTTTGYATWNR